MSAVKLAQAQETAEQTIARLTAQVEQMQAAQAAASVPGEPRIQAAKSSNGYVVLIVPNVGTLTVAPKMARWLKAQALKPFDALESATLDKLDALRAKAKAVK